VNRQEIIQKFITSINAQSYLEIGLGKGVIFNSINCSKKYGVDPQFEKPHDFQKGTKCLIRPTHLMTSDDFFLQNTECFDVIFIDGLHLADQVEKDINNSLKWLNDGGVILCHDMNPLNEQMQMVPRSQAKWNGDCWKAWVKVRSLNQNLNMFVIDADHGCGVIQKGSQELLDLNGLELTYENFNKNRNEWLNLISVDNFLKFMSDKYKT